MTDKKKRKRRKSTPEIMADNFLYLNSFAREKYGFDKNLIDPSGKLIIPDFKTVQIITWKMNQKRNLVKFPHETVKAGQINAFALINRIYQSISELYFKQNAPEINIQIEEFMQESPGKQKLTLVIKKYLTQFHPEISSNRFSIPDIIKDIFLLHIANQNPATSPFKELFEDTVLKEQKEYLNMITKIKMVFAETPPFGPQNQDLYSMLTKPIKVSPQSLYGQLSYIYQNWKSLIKVYLTQILHALDLLKEEDLKMAGPGKIPEYEFLNPDRIMENENFSQDTHWMSCLVLLAKNTYVWLYQLSAKYSYSILTLDQIPDQELDELAEQGFTGLWLIGLWERSPASQQIKKKCGNPEALASAYSIYRYRIAADLGSEKALQNLKERAMQRNIRLSCDMVPNHMGIDSEWVIKKPDYFLYLEQPPYPDYSFNGPDLSSDAGVGIFLEDHYFDQSNAAVVFKRVDRNSGETRYIYHGNDGTSMPWNDTAQLNYLNPETREAVIQTILSVARKFPIIRFDAAMTLTQKHYQRLWFPEPGTGGDIPSRSLKGLPRKEFQKFFPREFWKEVIERISNEVPDTLLLAEAFWLMEAYFVRNLGMHRVYNSAFMNFLKNEQNSKFRNSIKNIIKFDPEILKRLVNFMSNPDEETAVSQFGKEDKYFCTCLLMATLPGLPLFSHGQIEGFEEKYGMEYKKPYFSETADQELVDRHRREIFPLLKKRYIFAEVENFLFYDLHITNTKVDEDVIVFSNRLGNESFLVVVNNKFATKTGWIKDSVPFAKKKTNGQKASCTYINLLHGLGFSPLSNSFIIFRDYFSGLQYIRRCSDLVERGLYIQLEAYKYQLFTDFVQISDTKSGIYSQLDIHLKGQGIASINILLQQKFLNPLLLPLRNLFSSESIKTLPNLIYLTKSNRIKHLDIYRKKYFQLIQAMNRILKDNVDLDKLSNEMKENLNQILEILLQANKNDKNNSVQASSVSAYPEPILSSNWFHKYFVFIWFFLEQLNLSHINSLSNNTEHFFTCWGFEEILSGLLLELGLDKPALHKYLLLLKILIKNTNWFESITSEAGKSMKIHFVDDHQIKIFLGVNLYQNILWFHRESAEELFSWFYTTTLFSMVFEKKIQFPLADNVSRYLGGIQDCLQKAISESKCQWPELLKIMQKKISHKIKKDGFFPVTTR